MGIRISMKMKSNWTLSPIAHRIACAPLRTITHLHCKSCNIVSSILQLIGLSSAIKQFMLLADNGEDSMSELLTLVEIWNGKCALFLKWIPSRDAFLFMSGKLVGVPDNIAIRFPGDEIDLTL